jgi:hypothetical protein
MGFVVDKVVLGAGFFFRVPRFPLPICIPQIPPQSSSSCTGTIGQTMATVPSAVSFTQKGNGKNNSEEVAHDFWAPIVH